MKTTKRNSISVSSDAYFFEKDKSDSVLVMGVGNYLMGDEGVGVHLIQALSELELPDNLEILDGGTGGFLMLNCFDSYDTIVFVDATMDAKEEGTISLIRPKFAADYPPTLSVHGVGLKEMIEAAYLMENVPEIYLFTVSIDRIDPMSIGLSDKVKKAVSKLIVKILDLAEELHSRKL
ncbi:hydrogenase maturation protease [Aureitalea sp. L0-47]|uniref:hydrogenase maturation protease n=1 Tax=Aureitalea sp. L0-47 TaxID=2816962 RepID=UPI0022381802|nr:hydrogenase maturation protease [Aureitalea sp. L0-47]MCW5519841.1 hydrogenase maturation protease [Aureitalea sp. L0-47]